jgi:surface protein
MAKDNNLTDFLTDLANAIREKKGTNEPINPQNFSDEIASIENGGGSTPIIPSRPTYTGHADVEGLKAIGWTDEDIAYYQENGVNWNEEDDEYHKVTDDNKALYGVLTASNLLDYYKRIVYLPKIDTSGVTDMNGMFYGCYSLISIPQLNTSSVTNMNEMFYGCSSLTSIPLLDTSKVTDMSSMLQSCVSLTHVNLKNVKLAYQLNHSNLLSKESLLYLINNEAATSAITIKLASYAYDRWATDPDVVAALANHPNISISK